LIEEERLPAARQRDAASSQGDVHTQLPETRPVILPSGGRRAAAGGGGDERAGRDRCRGGRRWRLVGAPRLSSRRKPKRGARPPFEPPVGMGCWEDGVRPSPQTPLTGAGGTGRRLVRGRMVWPRGGAGYEGSGWRRDCHPGGSRKGGAAPFEPPKERQQPSAVQQPFGCSQ